MNTSFLILSQKTVSTACSSGTVGSINTPEHFSVLLPLNWRKKIKHGNKFLFIYVNGLVREIYHLIRIIYLLPSS